MVSPLTTVMAQLVTDWVALTPPTDTATAYRHVGAEVPDASYFEDETTAHRGFLFGPANMVDVLGSNATSTMVLWSLPVMLTLVPAYDDAAEAAQASQNEATLFVRAVQNRGTWGSGVWFVGYEPGSMDVEIDEDSGHHRVTFALTVQTEESD